MDGKPPLVKCKHCGLTISKKKRKEHLRIAHQISVGFKGWIRKHFSKRERTHGWRKPPIITLE
ncbi:MAG: hypothetical protein PVF96_05740 [Candidatus Bathyarchaeota archaeon]|jgi:hypothetical protein